MLLFYLLVYYLKKNPHNLKHVFRLQNVDWKFGLNFADNKTARIMYS